jgi:hypothetical protein
MITSTAFWYLIGAEYFYFDSFPAHKRLNIKKEISQQLVTAINTVSIPCRFDKKRIHRNNPYERLRDSETTELRMKAEELGVFIRYFHSIQNHPQKDLRMSVTIKGASSCIEDESFLSSTVASAYHTLNAQLKGNIGYGPVLNAYLQSFNLKNKSISVPWPAPIDPTQEDTPDEC